MPHSQVTQPWDISAIRRTMRVLVAHTHRIGDAQATAMTLRLVRDILLRRGTDPEVFQLPGTMPLLTIGHGPVLVITFLDDTGPGHGSGSNPSENSPQVSGDLATGPGVARKAGLMAVLGILLEGHVQPSDVTVVIETDRHGGSVALQQWIDTSERPVKAAIWEATDLPVAAPAVYRGATGTLVVRVSLRSPVSELEALYAGVVPDIGHQLAEVLGAMKSSDSEVLVPGFYDGIESPDHDDLKVLQATAKPIEAWIKRDAAVSPTHLPAEHVALGVFCAPSLMVRSIELNDAHPFVQRNIEATIEARLMPGQIPHEVLRAITSFIQQRLPAAIVEPQFVRPPTAGSPVAMEHIRSLATTYPVAPGNSPAGFLDTLGIPSLGFSTVGRDPSQDHEVASISGIVTASSFVADLCGYVAGLGRVEP